MKNWQLDLFLSTVGCIVLRVVIVDNTSYLLSCFLFGLALGLSKSVIASIYRGDE